MSDWFIVTASADVGPVSSASEPLTCSAEDSPVRTSALQEQGQDSAVSGLGSGLRWADCFAYYDPDTSSWRTPAGCLLEGLDEYSQTWPTQGMTRNGRAYQLVTLEPHTSGNESFLLPTPTKAMGERGWGISRTGRRRYSQEVIRNAMMFGYKPPVRLLEWMMGYEVGHTEIASDHSVTPSSRRSPSGSAGASSTRKRSVSHD